MSTVTSLTSALAQRLRHAIATALPEAGDTDPQVRPSEHADFQADGILPLAKPPRANPRQLANAVAAALPTDDLIARCEVSGPGFLNLTLADTASGARSPSASPHHGSVSPPATTATSP